MRKLEYVGKRFGKFVVLSESEPFMSRGAKRFKINCLCDCGRLFSILPGAISLGRDSCGCEGKARRIRSNITHGMKGTRTYRIWVGMKNRCTNPNNSWFFHYGAKGITVCERWLKFENFFADMGEAPAGRSLDRINGSKVYSKETCRWSTQREQVYNSRSVKMLTHDGFTGSYTEWAERLGVDRGTITRRMHKGWPIERVLSK